jgi:uncharacterized membrane protein YfcA
VQHEQTSVSAVSRATKDDPPSASKIDIDFDDIPKKWWQKQPVWDYSDDAGGNLKPKRKFTPHPLWKPQWHRMIEGGALRAGACLFLAGILCTAGGIGGGGIYVTVLMVFGSLSVHDAIPLSKVVVFAASTPALFLNLAKKINEKGSEDKSRSNIEWNLCRVVVPFALIGTLMGVFLNGVIPGKVIVGSLISVLVLISAMIAETGYRQHCEERAQSSGEADSASNPQAPFTTNDPKPLSPEALEARIQANTLSNKEVFIFVSMLMIIIYCGTVHYHAGTCVADWSLSQGACTHPIAQIVTFGQIQWMKKIGHLEAIGNFALMFAIVYCLVIGVGATFTIVQQGNLYGSMHKLDSVGESRPGLIMFFYVFMSATTGALAGLVGIGGGLIFSPVFIQMGVDVHIAVATSATCVIFTSASTTFQYLFSDRVIVSLIISFCVPHLMAAYTGTKIVHWIQDKHADKKSWVTWIVFVGVAISCGLAISKFFSSAKIAD